MSTPSKPSTPAWKLFAAGAAAVSAVVAGIQFIKRRQAAAKAAQEAADMASFPVINLARFLARKEEDRKAWEEDCREISRLLKEYGMLIIEDPRVAESENEKFLDMLERYYEQDEATRNADARPDLHYQVGVTPENIEKARNHCPRVDKLEKTEKPFTACPPEADLKSRFFWRMGERPAVTEFNSLNAEPVIPKAFPEWSNVMNRWGSLILESVHTVSAMAALGFGLPEDTFTARMKFAPHLLAPTASNLGKYNNLGTVFAAYHYDLNFLTIHGRSRFPGLFVWTRNGRKMQVRVPPRCLLLQAGKQFEWLTGGEVLAGFHEVIVVPDTLKAFEKAKAEKRSTWRISSTLFSHIASDQVLEPLAHFSNAEALAKYPPTKAGVQVRQELEAIALAAKN